MGIQKPEWFRLDAAKFLSDAQVDMMTTLELGACLRLLCRQWIDGFIPDDQRLVARLCRLDAPVMAEAWLALSQFFPLVETGKRANRFMWIERERIVAALEKKSDEGTKAARKRWDEVRKMQDAPPIGSPMPDPMQDQTRPQQTRPENTFPQITFADAPSVRQQGSKNSKPTEDQLSGLYSLYPRKRGKIEAMKALRKAVTGVMAGDSEHPAMSPDDALDYLAHRITLFGQSVRGSDQRFIPHPAKWLNAGSYWDDERDWKLEASPVRHATEKTVADLPLDYVSPSAKMSRRGCAQIGGQQ